MKPRVTLIMRLIDNLEMTNLMINFLKVETTF